MGDYDEKEVAEKLARAIEANREGLKELGKDDSIPQNRRERLVRKTRTFIRRHFKKPKAEAVTV